MEMKVCFCGRKKCEAAIDIQSLQPCNCLMKQEPMVMNASTQLTSLAACDH